MTLLKFLQAISWFLAFNEPTVSDSRERPWP